MVTPSSIQVTWDQLPNVTGYLVSYTTTASYAGGKSVIVNGGDTTSHTITKLVENTPYDITVLGLTKDGRKSEHSTEISITTQKAGQ